MNPWVALSGAVLWIASIAGSCWYVHGATVTAEQLKTSEIKQAIEDTRETARQGAASEIAKIKIRSTTITGKLQTVVRDLPVDCKLPDAGVQLLNEKITGKSSGSGRDSGSSVSRTGPTN